jgi:hypothetical protein
MFEVPDNKCPITAGFNRCEVSRTQPTPPARSNVGKSHCLPLELVEPEAKEIGSSRYKQIKKTYLVGHMHGLEKDDDLLCMQGSILG